jgi:hypothetical protein
LEGELRQKDLLLQEMPLIRGEKLGLKIHFLGSIIPQKKKYKLRMILSWCGNKMVITKS